MTCSVPNCERKTHGLGLCQMHYQRKKYGKATHLFVSDNLRPVKLDDVAVGWLVGVLGRLPGRKP